MRRVSNLAILTAALLSVGMQCNNANAAARQADDAAALDKAFAALKTYDWGTKPDDLAPIDKAVVASHGNPAVRKPLEKRLADILGNDVSRAAKDYVCRQLAIVGTASSVPVLATLLTDKDLSHMARYALERIPAPEAAAAMRDALPQLRGDLKAGVIASLGARRDRASVAALAALLGDDNDLVAATAARALGSIGDVEAAEALNRFSATSSGKSRRGASDALLICAERLLDEDHNAEAEAIYKSLQGADQIKLVRLAATRGLLAVADKHHNPDAKGGVLVDKVASLMTDEDGDFRALAFEAIREGVKGQAATEQFADRLPKLTPERQVELLDALAERGDRAALPAFAAMVKGPLPTQSVAIRGLGMLGNADQVATLIPFLDTAAEPSRTAAREGLVRLQGKDVNKAIADASANRSTALRGQLLGVLAERRAADCIPTICTASISDDAEVRMAAMAALGQVAGRENLAEMIQGVLKAEVGNERDAAEKAVMLVCRRAADAEAQEEALLRLVAAQPDEDQAIALLPMLGRVGGSAVLEVVEEAIAQKDSKPHEAGMRALCNWPDASVAKRLLELGEKADDGSDRAMALAALIRVAPLPDDRPTAEKLDLMKKAMSLATRDSDRKLIIQRASAIRSIEALRFIASYLDQPAFAQQACSSVVELARHKELREPNKAEFDEVLDAVIRTSKKSDIIDRAQRYQKGQT